MATRIKFTSQEQADATLDRINYNLSPGTYPFSVFKEWIFYYLPVDPSFVSQFSDDELCNEEEQKTFFKKVLDDTLIGSQLTSFNLGTEIIYNEIYLYGLSFSIAQLETLITKLYDNRYNFDTEPKLIHVGNETLLSSESNAEPNSVTKDLIDLLVSTLDWTIIYWENSLDQNVIVS